MKGTGIRVPSSSGRTIRRRFNRIRWKDIAFPCGLSNSTFLTLFPTVGPCLSRPPSRPFITYEIVQFLRFQLKRRRPTRTGFITFSGFSMARNSMRTTREKKKKSNPSLVIILIARSLWADLDFLTICSEFNFNSAKCFFYFPEPRKIVSLLSWIESLQTRILIYICKY